MRHTLKTTIFVLFLIGIAFSANAARVEDFMPEESVLYVQLQHIDEVYGEIETSETWQKAFALLPGESDDLRNGIRMAEAFLSTDLLSVLETIGYQTALAVWLDETGSPQVGFVVHSGGNLSELQRFTKNCRGCYRIEWRKYFTLRCRCVPAGSLQRYGNEPKYCQVRICWRFSCAWCW